MKSKGRVPLSASAPAGRKNDTATILHTQLILIEVAEPEILHELCADRRLGPLIVAQLSDRVAVVAPGSAKEMVQYLLKAGHTPRIIEGGSAAVVV
jgi:hypothetical protein